MRIGMSGFTDMQKNEYKKFKISTDTQVQTGNIYESVHLKVERANVHSIEPIHWTYKKAGKWTDLPLYLDENGEEVVLSTDYSQLYLPSDYSIWDTTLEIRAQMVDVDGYTYFDEITLYRLGSETGVQIVLDNQRSHLQRNLNGDFNYEDLTFKYKVYNNTTLLSEGEGENQYSIKASFSDGVANVENGIGKISELYTTFLNEFSVRLSFTVSLLGDKKSIKTSYFYISNNSTDVSTYVSNSAPVIVYGGDGAPTPVEIKLGLVKNNSFVDLSEYTLNILSADKVIGKLTQVADSYIYTINGITDDIADLDISFTSDIGDFAVEKISIKRKAESVPVLTFRASPSKMDFTYNTSKNIVEAYLDSSLYLSYGGTSLFGNDLVEEFEVSCSTSSTALKTVRLDEQTYRITMDNSDLINLNKGVGYYLNYSGSVKLKGEPVTSLTYRVPVSITQSTTVVEEVQKDINNKIDENIKEVNDSILESLQSAKDYADKIAENVDLEFEEFNKAWQDADKAINEKILIETEKLDKEISDRKQAVDDAIKIADSNAQGFANKVQTALDSLASADSTQKINGNVVINGTIGADKLIANSITAGQIAAGAITANLMAAESILAGSLKVDQAMIDKLLVNDLLINSMTAKQAFIAKIQAIDLSADKITSGTINADLIKVNSLKGDRIVARSISADKLIANSITAGEINAGSVRTAILVANSVVADNILADQAFFNKLTASEFWSQSVNAAKINAGSITTGTLSANLIYGGKLSAKNQGLFMDLDLGKITITYPDEVMTEDGVISATGWDSTQAPNGRRHKGVSLAGFGDGYVSLGAGSYENESGVIFHPRMLGFAPFDLKDSNGGVVYSKGITAFTEFNLMNRILTCGTPTTETPTRGGVFGRDSSVILGVEASAGSGSYYRRLEAGPSGVKMNNMVYFEATTHGLFHVLSRPNSSKNYAIYATNSGDDLGLGYEETAGSGSYYNRFSISPEYLHAWRDLNMHGWKIYNTGTLSVDDIEFNQPTSAKKLGYKNKKAAKTYTDRVETEIEVSVHVGDNRIELPLECINSNYTVYVSVIGGASYVKESHLDHIMVHSDVEGVCSCLFKISEVNTLKINRERGEEPISCSTRDCIVDETVDVVGEEDHIEL